MAYNFDIVIDRKNTNSVKYDFAAERGRPEGLIPLWVADMDFAAPSQVLTDIQKAVAHGVFGYTDAKDDYYQALINWFSSRFGYTFTRQDVIKAPGVVVALAHAVRAFTAPGEGVLIQTPVYHPFYSVIADNNRRIVSSPLIYKNGKYEIDFKDFERKIKDEAVKLFILCSPHNPVGRVWRRDELEKMGDICRHYGVLIVSDEIHCDFVYSGHHHTCMGSCDENAIVMTAPSKTFNLAGLQASNIIVKNEDLRGRLKAEMEKSGCGQLNTLGLLACQSAYTHGGEWLEELKEYLIGNIDFSRQFLFAQLPKVHLVEPQGTYLLWLDFTAYGLSQEELDRRVIEGAGLWLNSGEMFGVEGKGFQRMNIACPRATLQTALEQLASAFR